MVARGGGVGAQPKLAVRLAQRAPLNPPPLVFIAGRLAHHTAVGRRVLGPQRAAAALGLAREGVVRGGRLRVSRRAEKQGRGRRGHGGGAEVARGESPRAHVFVMGALQRQRGGGGGSGEGRRRRRRRQEQRQRQPQVRSRGRRGGALFSFKGLVLFCETREQSTTHARARARTHTRNNPHNNNNNNNSNNNNNTHTCAAKSPEGEKGLASAAAPRPSGCRSDARRPNATGARPTGVPARVIGKAPKGVAPGGGRVGGRAVGRAGEGVRRDTSSARKRGESNCDSSI